MLQITPIKTAKFHLGDDLFQFLDHHVGDIKEGDILVVTSKIIALAEKRIAPKVNATREEKHRLVQKEADYYLPASLSKYNLMLTIKAATLAVNAGVDESNIDGRYYLLLPKNPYQSAEKIWRYLKKRFNRKRIGVVITDSTTMPLRWGVFGNSLAHCGFRAINSKVGEDDLFGRKMLMTKINLPQSIAQAAVFTMGEVAESQPIALVSGVKEINFQQRPPTAAEIAEIGIDLKDDVYQPILMATPWYKGGKKIIKKSD